MQGPQARRRLAEVAPDAAAVGRFRVAPFTWAGVGGVAAGTGYTGEDGVELAVPAEIAEDLWSAIAAAGVVPAGLGARDTLRLEAALPLHGHELGPGITPLQAGLGWVVSWTKPEGFRGRDALEKERASGVPRRLIGLATADRRPPRSEADLFYEDQVVAQLTSGNFSPVLGHGIALALLPARLDTEAQRFEIAAHRGRIPAARTPLPFVTKKKG